ncbi:hypothetical protein FJT64_005022 [Amphibalanus amphitrite]|uniref:Uncharacterized protein n=1 Tax=Amphibalanus amphitrite TaxID=1232801 RepID=A0A6A4W6J6_AMPAM|nr:hypothetical protein FJT64_005022 [Amphibalanus amphitrite]
MRHVLNCAVVNGWLLPAAVDGDNLDSTGEPSSVLLRCCEELEMLGREFGNDEGVRAGGISAGAVCGPQSERPEDIRRQGIARSALLHIPMPGADRENPLPESTPGYMQMAFPEVFRSGDADPHQNRKLQTSLKHKVAEIERDLRVEDPTMESDASRCTLEMRVSAAWRDCQQEYVRHIGRCYTNWNAGFTKDGERTFDFAYDRKTTVCRASMAVQLDDALLTGDFAANDELYVRVINGTQRHTGHSGRGDASSAKDGCAVRRQVVGKAETEAARSADGRPKHSRGDGNVEYALKYTMKPVAPIRTTGDMLLSAMERREASDNVDIGVVQKMYNQAAASMCQSIFQAVYKNWQLPLLQKNLDVKRFSMSGCRVVKPANAADNPVYVYADSVERFNARLGVNIRHGNIPLADIQRKMLELMPPLDCLTDCAIAAHWRAMHEQLMASDVIKPVWVTRYYEDHKRRATTATGEDVSDESESDDDDGGDNADDAADAVEPPEVEEERELMAQRVRDTFYQTALDAMLACPAEDIDDAAQRADRAAASVANPAGYDFQAQ